MKLEYLVNQARKYIPLLSDNFSNCNKIKNIELKDGILKIETYEPLKLEVGKESIVFLRNIPKKIFISKIQKIKDDEAFLFTDSCHEQTKDPLKDNKVFINIFDCVDPLYNTKTEVLEDYQDGGHKIRIKVNKNTTDNPDVLKSYFLLENFGKYNGLKPAKVIAKNILTINFPNENDFILTNLKDSYILSNIRVYPAYDKNDAKAIFDRNIQTNLLEDKLNKNKIVETKIKKSNEYTAFIILDTNMSNTARNKTCVGNYEYKFSVLVFMMHRDIPKYIVRNEQDFITNQIFNKIFGEKRIILKDGEMTSQTTDDIKFLTSDIIEKRDNDLSILEIKYTFFLQTYSEDYKLPINNVRLNGIDMNVIYPETKIENTLNIKC